jgi:hypothetical protein
MNAIEALFLYSLVSRRELIGVNRIFYFSYLSN